MEAAKGCLAKLTRDKFVRKVQALPATDYAATCNRAPLHGF
jgi:hypothetical protein